MKYIPFPVFLQYPEGSTEEQITIVIVLIISILVLVGLIIKRDFRNKIKIDMETKKIIDMETKKMEVTDEEFEKLFNDSEFMKNVISIEHDYIEVTKGDKIPVSGWVFTIKIN